MPPRLPSFTTACINKKPVPNMAATPTVYLFVAATPWLAVLLRQDWKTRSLPNRYTLGGSVVILVWQFAWGGLPYLLNSLAGGLIAGALLLIPFLLRAAGAGDVKFLFASGLLVGYPTVFPMLFLISGFGLLLGIVMQLSGRFDAARLKHIARCLFDWRYDRKQGRLKLPDREDEKVRIPFGVAISLGVWGTLLLRIAGEYAA